MKVNLMALMHYLLMHQDRHVCVQDKRESFCSMQRVTGLVGTTNPILWCLYFLACRWSNKHVVCGKTCHPTRDGWGLKGALGVANGTSWEANSIAWSQNTRWCGKGLFSSLQTSGQLQNRHHVHCREHWCKWGIGTICLFCDRGL